MAESYWAVAQTVSKMEHIVRREIEKTNRGAFVPTYARHWKVDGRQYTKEFPLIGGYVFFKTVPDDWAGIPDIHGVYGVLAGFERAPSAGEDGEVIPHRVSDAEMARLTISHASGEYTCDLAPRYTKYFRGERPKETKRRRRPRPGRRIRNSPVS